MHSCITGMFVVLSCLNCIVSFLLTLANKKLEAESSSASPESCLSTESIVMFSILLLNETDHKNEENTSILSPGVAIGSAVGAFILGAVLSFIVTTVLRHPQKEKVSSILDDAYQDGRLDPQMTVAYNASRQSTAIVPADETEATNCRVRIATSVLHEHEGELGEPSDDRDVLDDRLEQIREARDENEREGGQPGRTRVENKTMNETLEALISKCYDNNAMKQELENLKFKTVERSNALKDLKAAMQRVTLYSTTEQKAKQKLLKRVAALEDELSANRQLSAETQQRQLDEVQTASRKTNQKQPPKLSDERKSHADTLRPLYSQVSATIDAQSVARNMFQCNALTLKELQSIQSKRSQPVKAAEELLNIVANQSSAVYGCFLTSLKETAQRTIYELIVKGSYKGFDEKFAHTKTIQKYYVFLLDKLTSKHSGLAAELYQCNVLSSEEMDSICSELTSLTQNEKLLTVLSRKTKEQFDQFLDALDTTGQRHVRNHITGRQVRTEAEDQEIDGEIEQDDGAASYELMEQQLKQANDTIATLLHQIQAKPVRAMSGKTSGYFGRRSADRRCSIL